MGLDLSSLEGFTRELLEEIARKNGIRSPEFRPRGELIRLLVRHHYGAHVQAGREGIVRGAALAAIGRTALGELLGLAVGQLLPKRLTRVLGRDAARRSEPSAEVPFTPRAESRTEQDATTPEPEPKTRTFVDTPPRTHSMARVLAAQGHRERAIEIYRELLTSAEDEAPVLQAELEAIERGEPLPARRSVTGSSRASEAAPSDDRLACNATASRALRVEWRVTDVGLRRARAVLGGSGEIALRLVCIERDPTAIVHSVVYEHAPLPRQGEWMTPELHGVERTVLALGVRADDRFVSITHLTPTGPAPITDPSSADRTLES